MEGSVPKVERAGLVPFGMGQTKPHHYSEILKTIWHNKRAPLFTWRVLRDGVCDGCALGTTGLKDFTMEGVHLCTVRLNLLPLNTMGAMDTRVLADVAPLVGRPARDLRHLGRLPYPMVRHRGDRGFRRVSWDEALDLVAGRLRATPPDRVAFYLTSRGITNEVYYVAAKVARFLGTNNVDNSARLCHAPSTTAMKETLGVAASTCSYSDWIGSDLVVFFGSDVPNNQPVTTKYLYYAKKHGTKVAVVNPFREPGLERYWVPSVFDSAFFGTRLADAFFQIHTGGDIAFLNGVMKHLIAEGWIDETFIAEHTTREAIGLLQGGDARLRRDVRKVEDRGLRLEHGHHAARLRRRQREGDHEPGLGPGHGGAGEVRPHAGSRPQRSPGWRRGGGGAEPVRRRTTGRGQGRRPNRPDVGLPTAYGEGPFRGRNGRRGP